MPDIRYEEEETKIEGVMKCSFRCQESTQSLPVNLGVWTQRRLAASWWQSFALPRVARRTSASQNVAHKVFIWVSILIKA